MLLTRIVGRWRDLFEIRQVWRSVLSVGEQMIPLGMKFPKSGDGYERWAGASPLQDYRTIPEARSALEALISDPDERTSVLP